MADPYSGIPEFQAEQAAIARRQKIAEQLMAQSMQATPQATAGGYVIPQSPLDPIAKIFQAFVGRTKADEADKDTKGIASKYNTGLSDELVRYQQARGGTPEVPASVATDEFGTAMPPAVPAVPGDPRKAVMDAMISKYPQLRTLAGVDLAQMNRHEDRKDTKEARLDAIAASAREGRITREEADRRRAEENIARDRERAADRENMIRVAASLRAPREEKPQTYKAIIDPLKPDQMIEVNTRTYDEAKYRAGDRSAVLGVAGKEPTAAKRDEKSSEGRDLLASELDNLRQHYETLNNAGAIPSSSRPATSNVASSVRASVPGQMLGRLTGTKEQDARNQIQSSRLRIMNAIKNATGMSSQQMNSNVELQTWLSSLTDPSRTYESNMGIINAIDDAFVKGKGKQKTLATPAAPAQAIAPANTVDALLDKYK